MMRMTTKLWLIIAASLILVGCIIFAGVMGMVKLDFTKLSTGRYETNQHEITEIEQWTHLKFKEVVFDSTIG